MIVLRCPRCHRCLAEASATTTAITLKLPCKACRRWVMVTMPALDSRPSVAASLA